MALHGSILINGNPLASWSARRLDLLEHDDQECDYEWEYISYYTLYPGVQKRKYTGRLSHVYSEGAARLLQKIMEQVSARENS